MRYERRKVREAIRGVVKTVEKDTPLRLLHKDFAGQRKASGNSVNTHASRGNQFYDFDQNTPGGIAVLIQVAKY